MTDTNETIDVERGDAQIASEVDESIEEQDGDVDSGSTSTSVVVERSEKQAVAGEIAEWVDDARELSERMGLDPYDVKFWVVSNDEMNELITYDGFQERYPHWRWGMKYDRQAKKSRLGLGKAFEIVNNDNPSHAFLQHSNSMADQKAVVTHVFAHADFFANNQWFRDSPNAASMLSHHGKRIDEIMSRPDVDREDVEWLIDTLLCIEDTIDQTLTGTDDDPLRLDRHESIEAEDLGTIEDRIDELDVSDSIREHMFDQEWIEENMDDDLVTFYEDVVGYFMQHGERYDEEEGCAVEFEPWEREVIRMIRDEFYYFAPQKMTKVMNEGWASFWETMMMADEGFADDDEFVEYADHQARVLTSPGLNPYKLGREIWEHIENSANRQEVVDKLLRVEGITPQTFHDRVDFAHVVDALDHPDAYSPAKRNFSLARRQNRGYLGRIDYDDLQEAYRYIVDYDRYDSVEDALANVDYTAGWERMREVRSTHIDVTFIDEFMDEEFVVERNYFTWDYNPRDDQRQVSSTDPEDVKTKLLLQFSNFGKPNIVVESGNFDNRGELLLAHRYNGIGLDMAQAIDVVERLAMIWGRTVHLKTISRDDESGDEQGYRIYYDPADDDMDEPFAEELHPEEVEYLRGDADFSTQPDEWMT